MTAIKTDYAQSFPKLGGTLPGNSVRPGKTKDDHGCDSRSLPWSYPNEFRTHKNKNTLTLAYPPVRVSDKLDTIDR